MKLLLRQQKKIISAAVVHIHEGLKKYTIDHGVLQGSFGALKGRDSYRLRDRVLQAECVNSYLAGTRLET